MKKQPCLVKSPLMLVFDGDMICFQACTVVEHEVNWYGDVWTLWADAADAKGEVDARIAEITAAVLDKLNYEGEYKIVLCFSGEDNFRKKIYPLYKQNRVGKRKPVCYHAIVDWCKRNYESITRPNLEADDLCGILATRHKGHTVIISADKDYKCIPSVFYNFMKRELYVIDEGEADYFHLMQTLMGDTADNYTGCPGIGAKTAQKLFADKGVSWETVVEAFKKKGLSESYALTQAQVARILRDENYDSKTGEIIPWFPNLIQIPCRKERCSP